MLKGAAAAIARSSRGAAGDTQPPPPSHLLVHLPAGAKGHNFSLVLGPQLQGAGDERCGGREAAAAVGSLKRKGGVGVLATAARVQRAGQARPALLQCTAPHLAHHGRAGAVHGQQSLRPLRLHRARLPLLHAKREVGLAARRRDGAHHIVNNKPLAGAAVYVRQAVTAALLAALRVARALRAAAGTESREGQGG